MRIETRKQDVIWGYIGAVFSMGSGFILLPLLLYFLTEDELGLWYIFLSVSSLVSLFEFGFNPTFARNITYVLTGVRRIEKTGRSSLFNEGDVDWHLLKTLMKTSKFVYGLIAGISLVASAVPGSIYILYVSSGVEGAMTAWGVFCVAIFFNLYFLYTSTFLRGFGDVAAENKAKTYSKLIQLAVSAVLLVLDCGLLGASIGYFFGGISLRLISNHFIAKHKAIDNGLKNDVKSVCFPEVKAIFSVVFYIAWRDGFVQVSNFASTQAATLLSSLFLSLGETGMYAILLQIASALYSFSSVNLRSHMPMFQSAYASGDITVQRHVVERGISLYWMMIVIGIMAIMTLLLPLLPLLKPGYQFDPLLFCAIAIYMALWNHHSLFCCLIVGMNRIPYLVGYLVGSALGIVLSALFMGVFELGVWGLVAGQFISQLVYNNWKWPLYVMKALGVRYDDALIAGGKWWFSKLCNAVKLKKK